MAELTFRSPGVGTREIDLSGPTAIKPQGTPAGVIGTAQQGPAFVPQTFATWQDFVAIFGSTDGAKLGPLAMYEWMKNSRAGTYLRVLGVGTGAKRSTAATSDSDSNSIQAGGVKNAGFTVGQRLVRGNGYLGNNDFAYSTAETLGRTYMLGAFMSSSAGSSVFEDAGLQEVEGAANATATLTVADAQALPTGDGAIISDGATASGGGIYMSNSFTASGMGTAWFTITFPASTGLVGNDGVSLSGLTYTFTGVNNNDIYGASVGTHEVKISSNDGSGGNLTGFANFAARIAAVINGDKSTASMTTAGEWGGSWATSGNAMLAFGSSWNLCNTSGVDGTGGDPFSVFVATVANTVGVKIQFRGSQTADTGTGAANFGPWGGAGALGASVAALTQTGAGGGLITQDAAGTDQDVTIGTSTGTGGGTPANAATVVVTNSAGTATTLTANATASGFVVGSTYSSVAATMNEAVAATIDTAIEAIGAAQSSINVPGTSLVTVTADGSGETGEIGNSAKLGSTSTTTGVFTVQGVSGATLEENLTGGAPGAINSVPILRGVVMCPSGVIASLSGSGYDNNAPVTSFRGGYGIDQGGGFIGDADVTSTQAYNFTILLNGHKDTEAYPSVVTASLSPWSPSYLPNVLNTDPMKIQEAGHYLYNYYTVNPNIAVVTGSGVLAGGEMWVPTGSNLEPIVFLLTSSLGRNDGSATIPNYEGWQDRFRTAFAPWTCSQIFGSTNKDLFRLHSLNDGINGSNQFRVQVENIKNGKLDNSYGQFDVIVKRIIPPLGIPTSEDAAIETFNGVNLDPSSDNYIGRRIGDYNIYYDFDKMAGNQRVVVEGTHPNVSKHIRVEMHKDVTNGNVPKTALPIAYRGPYHLVTSGSSIYSAELAPATQYGGDTRYLAGEGAELQRMNEPPNPLRQNIALGSDPSREVNSRLPWGFQFETLDSATEPNRNTNVETAIKGWTKYYPHFATSDQAAWVGNNVGALDSGGTVYDSDRFNNNFFSMERIQIHTKSTGDVVDPKEWAYAVYRRKGSLSASIRKEDGTYNQGRMLNVNKDFSDPASTKFLKFTYPLQGGYDGVNIFDKEKSALSNLACVREMDDENQGQADGPTIKTYMKALDVMSEKSDVDVQILAVPGIRETKVTDHALEKTEERFDAIYIMDIEEKDALNNLVTASNLQPVSVGNTVDNFKSRVLDTSFGAAYFPDVLVTDPSTLTNIRCAPSVAVIGAFALNDKVAYPWYAPAGFTRGALSRVVQSTVNLSRGNLDSLYDADINPITKFPTSEGVVIFGQKTLLAAASSLDRVNVRRLLIDIRRKVRKIADTFLFEPNREDTLARFSASVNPVLTRIQQQQGLDRFKVIIDTTTTTQADVENNTIRGKIFLQPTRSIEFISLDFVVTNNGTEI
ncbi:MAG TPA: hypothetical protein EYF95_07315 [Flavobacteriales bacterium]|nr:hypothetical protein [Flavobacteriales bacterium]